MENSPLKILAIDDNEDNLISVKALIREAFPQVLVLTATEAGKGLELAQAEDPDVILLDVVMSGMDGFAACQQLKANPLTRHIPVVFLTALKGDKAARIRALEVGAEAFLAKPLDEIELTAQIRAMQKLKAASERERAEKEHLTELVAARTRELELAHTAALNLLEDLRKENEARRESESRLQKIFDILPIGLWFADKTGKLLRGNPAGVKIWGAEPRVDPAQYGVFKARRLPSGEEIAPDDWALAHTIREGTTTLDELLEIDAFDGRKKIILNFTAPVLDDDGAVLGAVIVNQDITARKLAEDAQRETSLRLQESVRAANVGLWDWDLATHCVHYSSEWKRQIGYADAEIGDAFEEWESRVHPEDLAPTLERVREAITGDSRRYQAEFRFRHKDGSYRWIVAQCSVLRAENGKAVRVVGSHLDLTESRHVEEALRESEARFRLLFENLPSGVVVHAADTAVLFANPEALRLLGLTLEQIQGKAATDPAWCFLREDGEALALEDYPVNRLRTSGKPFAGQIVGIRLPGQAEPNWVQCSAYPQLDASGPISQVIVAFTDITARKQAEEALLKANEHLAYAQSAARAGVWDWDMATGELAWSPEMFRLFEFDPNTSSASFAPWRSAVHPEDREKAEARIHQAVLDHRPLENEYRIVTSSGRVKWIGAQGNTSYGADGTPLRMSGICLDITARKQAEAVLRESEERFKAIANYAVSWESWFGPEGKYIWVNPAVELFTGYSAQEIMALPDFVSTVIADEDRAVFRGRFQEAIRGSRGDNFEFRYLHKNGTTRWLSVSWQPIYDAQGNPLGTRSSGYDITDRKQAEEKEAASQALLRLVLDRVPAYICAKNLAGRFLLVNQKLADFYGRPIAAMTGSLHADLCEDKEELRAMLAADRAVIESGQIQCIPEETMKNPDGSTVVLETYKIPFTAHNEPAVLVTSTDITARKQAEAELRASQQLAESIIESIPGTFYMLDEAGNYVRWSAYQRDEIVGKPDDQVAGFPALDTIHPDDRALVQARIANVLGTGVVETVEGRVLLRGGPKFQWLLMTGRQLMIAGHPYLVGIGIDITARRQAEEALRALSQRDEAILAAIPEIVMQVDVNKVYTWANRVGLEFFGDDVIGKEAAFYFEGEQETYAIVKPLFDGAEDVIRVESWQRRRDGQKRLLVWLCRVLKDALGQVIGTLATAQDITDHRMADDYRTMGAEVLEILNEPGNLPDALQRIIAALKTRTGLDAVGVRLQDGEDFPYYAQDGFSREFLLTENTLIQHGKEGGVCRDKDGHVCLECTCGLVISGKTPAGHARFTPGGSFWTNDSFPLLDLPADQEPRLHPRNTCIHQGYASVALVPVRGKDRIVGLLHLNDRRKGRFTRETVALLEGIASHLGDALIRKQVEEKLKEAQALTATVVENIPLMIFLKEATDLRFVVFNRAGEELLGYDRKSFLGKNNLDLFPPEQAAHFMAKDREVLDGKAGVLDIPEEPIQTARQGERLLHTRKVCIRGGDGKTKYLLGISEDITEHKRAEAEHAELQEKFAQAQKMEAVGQLAGGVAHDFNNMLQVILGTTELLLSATAPGDPRYDDLQQVRTTACRSADLTRQLLAFARKQTIAPRVLDLNDTVGDMLKMLRRLIGEDIELLWKPGAEVGLVNVDPSQLDQILANLAVNARDAIAGVGKLTIETGEAEFDAESCRAHTEAAPGAYVVLAVSDTGCGMDKATQAHIFEPFFTTKGVGEGTGLGLATVYGIVKQNQGFVTVYSEPGKGTTFRIYLPRHAAPTTETETMPRPAAVATGTETVLLAEDEAPLLHLARRILESLGYTVLAAGTPDEALRLAAEYQGEIHLLLTDVVMPGMSGRDLHDRLAVTRPETKCLFMSGYTADAIAHRGVLYSGLHFIEKPFSRAALAAKLREVLAEKP